MRQWLDLLAIRDFRNLWISNTLVQVAQAAFPIAIAVVIIDAGGSAAKLGGILAARIAASTIFGLFGGVWADRAKRKFVMISADSFRGILIFSIAFLPAATTPTWTYAVIVFLIGIGDSLGGPANNAILPTIINDEKLQHANVLRGITYRVSMILGPVIGGILVALLVAQHAFLVIGAMYVIGTLLLLSINEPPFERAGTRPTFLADLREGLKTVWEMPWVAALIAMASVQLIFFLAIESVLLPVITKREFQTNSVMALALAAFAVGGSISSLVALKMKPKNPGRVAVLVWGLLVVGFISLAFPINKEFVIAAFFIAGFSIGPWDAFWPSAIQREVPMEKQGRVFAIDQMGSLGLAPVGMALVGPVTSITGERNFILFSIAFHLFICAITLLVPGVAKLKNPSSAKSEQI